MSSARPFRSDCALCLREAELQHSHIFPEFFYDETYGDEGKFVAIRRNPLIKPKQHQKGLREYLLCGACEVLISRTESYAASLLRRLDHAPVMNGQSTLSDVDLRTFKLFGVSLLWRAGVATHGIFRATRLGPFAEHARKMLLDGRGGTPGELGFLIARVVGSQAGKSIISGPMRVKLHGRHCYHFLARGYRWFFIASRDAGQWASALPLVGSSQELRVRVFEETDESIINWIRSTLPWSRPSWGANK